MQVIIHQWAFNGSFDQLASLPRQELVNDWFGYDVEPSAEFRSEEHTSELQSH